MTFRKKPLQGVYYQCWACGVVYWGFPEPWMRSLLCLNCYQEATIVSQERTE